MYYYPCNDEDKANFHIWDKRYIEIEVMESEREALRELDRFEYNTWHQLYRHNEPFPEDDEVLSPREQKRWTNKDIRFSTPVIEQ